MFVIAALLLSACESEAPKREAVAEPGPAVASAPALRAPPPAAAPAKVESLESFSMRFRAAALAGDAAAIRSLSASVVLQRGILDDTPVVRLPASRVPAVLAKVLRTSDGIDDANRTQRELLEATPVPTRDPEQPADYHRFGDLVFERGATGWRLTEVYFEPEE